MSIGTGWRMISLKTGLRQARILLSHNEHRRIGLAFVPPKLACGRATGRGNELRFHHARARWINRDSAALKSRSQLVAEPRSSTHVAPPPTVLLIPSVRMNSESEEP